MDSSSPLGPGRNVTAALAVRFLVQWGNYLPRDVACFREDVARLLVAQKIARPVNLVSDRSPPPRRVRRASSDATQNPT